MTRGRILIFVQAGKLFLHHRLSNGGHVGLLVAVLLFGEPSFRFVLDCIPETASPYIRSGILFRSSNRHAREPLQESTVWAIQPRFFGVDILVLHILISKPSLQLLQSLSAGDAKQVKQDSLLCAKRPSCHALQRPLKVHRTLPVHKNLDLEAATLRLEHRRLRQQGSQG